MDWYNNNHRHNGIKFLKPNQRHAPDHELNVLAKRSLIYKSAKLMNPGRWTKETRDWSIVDKVWLNHEKVETSAETKMKAKNVS